MVPETELSKQQCLVFVQVSVPMPEKPQSVRPFVSTSHVVILSYSSGSCNTNRFPGHKKNNVNFVKVSDRIPSMKRGKISKFVRIFDTNTIGLHLTYMSVLLQFFTYTLALLRNTNDDCNRIMVVRFCVCITSLKSAHSIGSCLVVRGQLHGVHFGDRSPFRKNS